MTYGSALIAGAAIVTYTGVQDLANLTTDSELVLDTFALSASNAVYRRLQARGIDPTLITNQEQLYDAVAYEAVARLALAGYIPGGNADAFAARAREELTDYRPVYASADSPRNAKEGIPAVGHHDAAPTFSGKFPAQQATDYFSEDTPSAV